MLRKLRPPTTLRRPFFVSTRLLASVPPPSKKPELNQFQNPAKVPKQFKVDTIGGVAGTGIPLSSAPIPPTPPRHSWTSRVVAIVSLLGFSSSALMAYVYLHRYTLSSGVVEDLHEAILKEEAGAWEEAIVEYERVLKRMDTENVCHCHVSYLGAAVRMAELYEMHGRPDKALRIYELLANYMAAYIADHHPPTTVWGQLKESLTPSKAPEYDIAVECALTLAIKYASLLPASRRRDAKITLLQCIVQAQRQVVLQYPPFLEVLNSSMNQNILMLYKLEKERQADNMSEEDRRRQFGKPKQTSLDLPIFRVRPSDESVLLGLFAEGWPSFTGALVDARDVYANLCLDAGDYTESAGMLATNAQIIQRHFGNAARLSICMTKLAVVLQMISGTLADRLVEDRTGGTAAKQDDLQQYSDEFQVLFQPAIGKAPQMQELLIQKTYEESEVIFKKTLEIVSQVKDSLNAQTPDLDLITPAFQKSEMVSSCGLALIRCQNGDYKDAMKYLQRARVLAVRLHAKDYLEDINKFIDDVKKETE